MEDTFTSMPCAAVVVLKTDGTDGSKFPLHEDALIGRCAESDIRVRLPTVSRKHCLLKLRGNKVYLHNLAELNPSVVNDEAIVNYKKLTHGDVFAVGDRRFRLEYTGAKNTDFENTIVDDEATIPMAGFAAKAFAAPAKLAETPKAVAAVPFAENTAVPNTPKAAAAAVTMIAKVATPAGAPKSAKKRGLPTPIRRAIEQARKAQATPKPTPKPIVEETVQPIAKESVQAIAEESVQPIAEVVTVPAPQHLTFDTPVAENANTTEEVVAAIEFNVVTESAPIEAAPVAAVVPTNHMFFGSPQPNGYVSVTYASPASAPVFEQAAEATTTTTTTTPAAAVEQDAAEPMPFAEEQDNAAEDEDMASDYDTCDEEEYQEAKAATHLFFASPAANSQSARRLSNFVEARVSFGGVSKATPVTIRTPAAVATVTPCGSPVNMSNLVEKTPAATATPAAVAVVTVETFAPTETEDVPMESVIAEQAVTETTTAPAVDADIAAIHELISAVPIAPAVTVTAPTMRVLPTPVRNAIKQSRRISSSTPIAVPAAAAPSPAKKPATPAATVAAPKGLPTPIRDAIKKRQHPATPAAPVAEITVPAPAESAPLAQRILPTPIRNAIKSRKVSTAAKPVAAEATVTAVAAEEVTTNELVFEAASAETAYAIDVAVEQAAVEMVETAPITVVAPVETVAVVEATEDATTVATTSPSNKPTAGLPPRSTRKTGGRTGKKSAKKAGIAALADEDEEPVAAIPISFETAATATPIAAVETVEAPVETIIAETITEAVTETATEIITETITETITDTATETITETITEAVIAAEAAPVATVAEAEEAIAAVETVTEAVAVPIVAEATPAKATPAKTTRSTRKTGGRSAKATKSTPAAEEIEAPVAVETMAVETVAVAAPAAWIVPTATEEATEDVDTSSDAEACVTCGDADTNDDNLLLLCDKCDKGFHQKCVGVAAIPEGEWFCADCDAKPAQKKRGGRKEAAPKTPASSKKRAHPTETVAEEVEVAAATEEAVSVDASHLVGTDLDKLTVVAIKAELKAFGLSVAGIKKELVTRLEEFVAAFTASKTATKAVVEEAAQPTTASRSTRRTTTNTTTTPVDAPVEPAPAKRATRRTTTY